MIRYRRDMLNPEQQKIFASLTCNTRVRVRFAEVTDPVWIHDCEDGISIFNDAADAVYSGTMVDLVHGVSGEWVVDEIGKDHVTFSHTKRTGSAGEPETIHVTPAHLRDLEILAAGDRWNRRETAVTGLEYSFVQHPDGILEVGCQKIPREGQEQIVRLLAERLDLEVVPVGTTAAAREACRWIDSPYIDNDCSGDLSALQDKLLNDS